MGFFLENLTDREVRTPDHHCKTGCLQPARLESLDSPHKEFGWSGSSTIMIFIQPHLLHLLLILFAFLFVSSTAGDDDDDGFCFIFNDSELVGAREITPNGDINHYQSQMSGLAHTFYSLPLRFKSSNSSHVFSFSTSFVFGIVPETTLYTFHGMTFAIAPSKAAIINSSASEYLGLFNRTNDGNTSNHILALELDTFKNLELSDIDSNHVGLDINSVVSVFATTASRLLPPKWGFYKPNSFKLTTNSSLG
ncbi:hypothetical protein QVD17_36214 [Tagetes erecta]|uniref:Legume lectin domain-containing protein n=1 Tax=Tagetes erecta TaxID=13708 RepID=A0AAD8JRY5_TARER|nr:hypothetical protein QVD17_36214 [Tagetes erecta]